MANNCYFRDMDEFHRSSMDFGRYTPFIPFFKDGRELMFDAQGILYVNVGKQPIEKGLVSPDGNHWRELERMHEN